MLTKHDSRPSESSPVGQSSLPLLEVRQISKYFGGVVALHQVNAVVYPGEIVGMIGPNGSGKTTFFDCLSRVQAINDGTVLFKGTDITRFKPYEVAHLGLARTFQVIRVYRKMTVLENMLLSRQWRGESLFDQLRASHLDTEARANDLIDFLTLKPAMHEKAGNLSGGQQRLLEIGMALMPDPDLILLDEATSGVSPTLIETIKDRVRQLNREQGKSFLLIEHNMQFISNLCNRVYVLNYGKLLTEGTPTQVINNKEVIEAYFGAPPKWARAAKSINLFGLFKDRETPPEPPAKK